MNSASRKTDPKTPISYKRAFSIIIPLCLLSVLVAGAVISIANDMYAFVKPYREVTVSVTESLDDKKFSELLQEQGVINNALVFRLYLRSKKKSEALTAIRGEWTLNSNMSYREILLQIF